MNTKDLIIGKEASELLKVGFNGFNGCGSNKLSKILCSIVLLPLSKEVVADLQDCWLIHDAEYTISTSKKSKEHRREADDNLAKNMLTVLIKHNSDGKKGILIVSLIHTALVVGGDSAYWKKKSSGGWDIYKTITVILLLTETYKILF